MDAVTCGSGGDSGLFLAMSGMLHARTMKLLLPGQQLNTTIKVHDCTNSIHYSTRPSDPFHFEFSQRSSRSCIRKEYEIVVVVASTATSFFYP